jgi:UDP-3-O-[3-hydroxymyristoyl] glucosamine N-acyltransferase
MPALKSKYSLSDLAAQFELTLNGDGSKLIDGVSTLKEAGSTQITFLANLTYENQLPVTAAGAVILRQDDVANCPVDSLVAPDPYLAYARRENSGPLAETGRTGEKNSHN